MDKQVLETNIHKAVKDMNSDELKALYIQNLPEPITVEILGLLHDYSFMFLKLYMNACKHEFVEIFRKNPTVSSRNLEIMLPYSGDLSSEISCRVADGEVFVQHKAKIESSQIVYTNSSINDIDSL